MAAAAAFAAYFCMYAFRKPFTAGTFEGPMILGMGFKSALVVSQVLGYMVSKFIGIKVVSEMRAEYRAVSIIGLIVLAELALVGFAFVPTPLKLVMIFLNGLPLGMIFGLVLGYLEGRTHTEALSAVLCASFIVSSGVVKSVGSWLIQVQGVSEYMMPMVTGMLFFIPLLLAVWVLQATPPPDALDKQLRFERVSMTAQDRRQFFLAYWPGLCLLILVYIALTVARTVRDDFGVEIWKGMGVDKTPSVFARCETWVGINVVILSGLTIWIRHNWMAIRIVFAMMCIAFVLVIVATFEQSYGRLTPLSFMVASGIGLYVPYVAYHTTIFERLIAIARMPSNLGFLMYLADSIGYLGYAAVIVMQNRSKTPTDFLSFFRTTLLVSSFVSIFCLLLALLYFRMRFAGSVTLETKGSEPSMADNAAPEGVGA